MLNSKKIWIISFFITVSFAFFQRFTGPTYPVYGKIDNFSYKLPRSCTIGKRCIVTLKNKDFKGYIEYKRFKTKDDFSRINFSSNENFSFAILPEQPPAGKLEYKLKNEIGEEKVSSVIVRFKGNVPALILIPHIILMFLFMLYSVKIFIAANFKKEISKKDVFSNLLFLLIGGFIFGPLTQYYAFGDLWTGFPFGHDLTDNKTLIMLIVWISAYIAVLKNKKELLWINIAFLFTAVIYLVPHSLLGSELDYQKIENAGK